MTTASVEIPQTPAGMPSLKVRLCECARCVGARPFRVFHWFCAICKAPGARAKVGYDYELRAPHYRKTWSTPGQMAGIAHEVCSEPCRVDYLRLIGVAPERQFEEPQPQPQRPSHEPSARTTTPVVDE